MDHESSPESIGSPTIEPRLVADAMLGRLARWLRILGFDTLYDTALDDLDLVRIARAENRVLLTQDRPLAQRRDVRALLVRSSELTEQLAQVVCDLALRLDDARSRCSICNAPLEPAGREQVAGRVPPYVLRTQDAFRICPICTRVYWEGTHWQGIRRVLGHVKDATDGQVP
jgi:uncharacterized protein